ncbi:cryptochrome/photolyase family protein [Pigmentibacter sp. JX0631]|uniref:cryptochrome/photolyase family protein n=1 Tax=Pigmentibacter sp. JX0631 TaxID=2976982 RepID=UPI00246876CC|nr:cryptochrome/photolyase family protein [Pigmentibacter sp. JX0631]WGL59812.1 cryptochrome/photolyase family protein [Pigmentibacter sp. JX0631]
MTNLVYIMGDQLSESISSLRSLKKEDIIFFCETSDEFTDLPHHPKKIAFLLATRRHFAEELKEKGLNVFYIKLDDQLNSGSIRAELKKAIHKFAIKNMIITEPSEFKNKLIIEEISKQNNITIQILEDDRFFCSIVNFKKWSVGKKSLRMEFFYRELRKQNKILLEKDGSPTGGLWNYDKENRKPPSKSLKSLKRISHKKSLILLDVINYVKQNFSQNFGTLEPFYYAITRKQALIELNDFIERILNLFGDYQDAMLKDEAYLHHSLLSSYINVGLLLPKEICSLVEKAYKEGKVSLNSAEGFIRQILGWREYVRGIYWLKMPSYVDLNFFNAKNPLPFFFWGGKTKMNCINNVVAQTKEHSYSHHIQRLMITGNFALIAGLDVKEVHKWYLSVYSDAFEWVEMPNTIGMALFADGGIVASKPYAASANYISKMSNFCMNCFYNSKETVGVNSCPFNSLYWNFINKNKNKFQENPRMSLIIKSWENFSDDKKKTIILRAEKILNLMENNDL